MERTRTRIDLKAGNFSTGNKRRTPGLHLTDIIKDVMLDMGVDRSEAGFAGEQLNNFQLHGYLWEDVFTEKLRDYLEPGQLESLGLDPLGEYIAPFQEIAYNGREAFFVVYDEKDNMLLTPIPRGYVIMSPDGMRIWPERLLEMKWTTLSLTMDPDKKRPEWGIQKKGYLAGLSALLGTPINEVECPVLFACGDYKASGPVHEMWVEKYGDGEIQDNWEMLMDHVRHKVAGDVNHRWREWL